MRHDDNTVPVRGQINVKEPLPAEDAVEANDGRLVETTNTGDPKQLPRTFRFWPDSCDVESMMLSSPLDARSYCCGNRGFLQSVKVMGNLKMQTNQFMSGAEGYGSRTLATVTNTVD